jgi:hypothetical protein
MIYVLITADLICVIMLPPLGKEILPPQNNLVAAKISTNAKKEPKQKSYLFYRIWQT